MRPTAQWLSLCAEARISLRLVFCASTFTCRRRFRSSGSQRWQKLHIAPFSQPFVYKKAHGLHSPLLCRAEPMLGSSPEPGAGMVGGGAMCEGAAIAGNAPGRSSMVAKDTTVLAGASAVGLCGAYGAAEEV